MVATVNTTKYTIENDLTKKEKKKKTSSYTAVAFQKHVDDTKQPLRPIC